MAFGSRIILAYRRWRHTKGYGVHSPYAYRLVRLALHPSRGYGYYGYDAIEETLPAGENYGQTKRKDARLLLRLVATAGARRVVAETVPPVWLEVAAEAAGAPVVIVSDVESPRGDDILLLRGNGSCDNASRWLKANAIVMALDPGDRLRQTLTTPRAEGLLFDGKRIIIASGRREMAFVKYDMRF